MSGKLTQHFQRGIDEGFAEALSEILRILRDEEIAPAVIQRIEGLSTFKPTFLDFLETRFGAFRLTAELRVTFPEHKHQEHVKARAKELMELLRGALEQEVRRLRVIGPADEYNPGAGGKQP